MALASHSATGRLAFVDRLRGLAVLAVYFTHATAQFGPVSDGSLGRN